ncbi:hypothetical protein Ahia01_000159700, partial [Argonauta hians]
KYMDFQKEFAYNQYIEKETAQKFVEKQYGGDKYYDQKCKQFLEEINTNSFEYISKEYVWSLGEKHFKKEQSNVVISRLHFWSISSTLRKPLIAFTESHSGKLPKYVSIFKALYQNTTCRVRTRRGMNEDSVIVTGVLQGCILSPLLFLILIDFTMRRTFAEWGQDKLTYLDYAHNLVLSSHTHSEL